MEPDVCWRWTSADEPVARCSASFSIFSFWFFWSVITSRVSMLKGDLLNLLSGSGAGRRSTCDSELGETRAHRKQKMNPEFVKVTFVWRKSSLPVSVKTLNRNKLNQASVTCWWCLSSDSLFGFSARFIPQGNDLLLVLVVLVTLVQSSTLAECPSKAVKAEIRPVTCFWVWTDVCKVKV